MRQLFLNAPYGARFFLTFQMTYNIHLTEVVLIHLMVLGAF